MHGLHINEICLSSWCNWHGLHINEIFLSSWCNCHGLRINEISLSSWCKLFAQIRANNHTLCHRSLPLFFWHSWHSNLKSYSALVLTLAYLRCVSLVTKSQPPGHVVMSTLDDIKSLNPQLLQWAIFITTIPYIYDTMPWVGFRTEWLSIWTRPKQPVAQIYI